MRSTKWIMVFILAGTMVSMAQEDLVIQSFDAPGRLVFDEVTNAFSYRVEWAADTAGPWTSSWSPQGYIEAAGAGQYTSSVLMHYRVVALSL